VTRYTIETIFHLCFVALYNNPQNGAVNHFEHALNFSISASCKGQIQSTSKKELDCLPSNKPNTVADLEKKCGRTVMSAIFVVGMKLEK
jgi:hypothetical protein